MLDRKTLASQHSALRGDASSIHISPRLQGHQPEQARRKTRHFQCYIPGLRISLQRSRKSLFPPVTRRIVPVAPANKLFMRPRRTSAHSRNASRAARHEKPDAEYDNRFLRGCTSPARRSGALVMECTGQASRRRMERAEVGAVMAETTMLGLQPAGYSPAPAL